MTTGRTTIAAAKGAFLPRHVSQDQVVLAVTVVLALFFSLFLTGFASTGNLLTLARNVSVLGILSLGMAIVVIARGLDLSQIVSMAVGPAFAMNLAGAGMPLGLALAAGLGLVVCLGVFNGLAIAFLEIPALFTTLASGFLAYGLARLTILNGFIAYVPPGHDGFVFLGQGAVFGVPMPIVIFAAVALLVHLLMSRTSIGRFIYAHGDSAAAASLSGIPVRPLTLLEYMLCAAIAFVAGLVAAASTSNVNTQVISSTLIFDVILVVVLGGISLSGGRGSVWSVVVGTALIGTLLNGMTIRNMDGTLQNIVKGLVLLAAILIDNRLHPRDEETARQGE